MKIEYPKWLYHKTEDAKIVQTKEEHDEVGKGWQEAPFEVNEELNAKTEEAAASSETSEVTYKKHMASWESKEEKESKAKLKKSKKAK